jgi:hypothetical protein
MGINCPMEMHCRNSSPCWRWRFERAKPYTIHGRQTRFFLSKMHGVIGVSLNDYGSLFDGTCKLGMHFGWEERKGAKWIFSNAFSLQLYDEVFPPRDRLAPP